MHADLRRLAAASVFALCGCSAMVAGIGTNEEEFIHPGSTKSSITEKLGSPVEQATLSVPQSAADIQRAFKFSQFVEERAELGATAKIVHTRANFLYVGVLQGKHDVGEAASLSLMTLGATELIAPVRLIGKTEKRKYVLTVWFDQEGNALVYRWVGEKS